MSRRLVGALLLGALTIGGLAGCGSTRQIDVEKSKSFPIEGTSWYGFCQGRNAFIWVPSRTDTDPDELEAVVYDDYRCVGQVDPSSVPSPSSKPDADPDGIIDNEND